MLSNLLIFCHSLLLLPSIFPNMRVFSNESALCSRWPKYWSFSFSISRSNEYSGLISFRIDLFDLLAVQGTLQRLLQYQNSKASVLRHSAFFMVDISLSIHDYWENHSFDYTHLCGQSDVSALVKNLPTMQEIRVQSLDREDPPEKGMATHSSILAWRTTWTEESCRLHSMGL